jgi:hypothetical protein
LRGEIAFLAGDHVAGRRPPTSALSARPIMSMNRLTGPMDGTLAVGDLDGVAQVGGLVVQLII